MTTLLTLIAAAAHDPAEEGRNIIVAMLLTGLVFLAVIALGELVAWRGRRRRHRKRSRPPEHARWREYEAK
jgi:heme/copper-type cytochrome/quinol oxidase subunit 2